MCVTQINFKIACGHVIYEIDRCPESAIGSCEHTYERSVHLAFCNECAVDPSLVLPYDVREANHARFHHRTELDAQTDLREAFNADLAAGHILASISSDSMSHGHARALAREHSHILSRLRDRIADPSDVFIWDIDRLDGVQEDRNRVRVLGDALLRLPEHILRNFTYIQLQHHTETLRVELEERRAEIRADSTRLQRARQLLLESEPRDPTGRTSAERLAAEKATRSRAIPSILTFVDINTLEDNEQDRSCTICTDPLGVAQADHEAEEPCSLPCGHIIGRSCITQWLETNTTCPFCWKDYRIELSRAPSFIGTPRPLSPAAPLYQISPERRREAQIAQAGSRRRRDDQDPDREVRNEDFNQPAGDAEFLAGLADAVGNSVQQMVQLQVEAREAAERDLISPLRQSVITDMRTTQSAIRRRRQTHNWRLHDLEHQLEGDLEAQATNITQQTAYLEDVETFDHYIHTLVDARNIIVDNMQATEGDVLILNAHDDILDDAYRARDLLQVGHTQAVREGRRIYLDIEQDYINLDNAYIYSDDREDLDDGPGTPARYQAEESPLWDQQALVPNNSPAHVSDGLDELLQLLQ
ncbi:hypothetical protein VTL71DRAFT_6175 [Oculimacula yallundae]|uniref:RING-type domain-containing protein n=1 Tax=Oculimacula yallundae TaxID=86028 RepID=A0ABR4BZN0_9HELO